MKRYTNKWWLVLSGVVALTVLLFIIASIYILSSESEGDLVDEDTNRYITTEDSLAGTDTNGDGVWDYVENYLNQSYPDQTTRMALRRIAVIMQTAILESDDSTTSVHLAGDLQHAIECLYFVRPDDARGAKDDLKAEILNTLERSVAYTRFSDRLGGSIFPAASLSDLESTCNF